MIVAGFGFRATATIASLQSALDGCGITPDAIATPADKAQSPVLLTFAKSQNLRLLAIPLTDIRAQITTTTSPAQPLRYGNGSVAEAAALAACHPDAKLIVARRVSPDRQATIAVAKGSDP